jgi:hypothetical protein
VIKREDISFTLGADEPVSFTFTVTQLPPTKAYQLSAKLAKTLGGALGELASLGAGADLVDLGKLGTGLQKALGSVTDAQLEDLLSAMLQGVTASGNGKVAEINRQVFDSLFFGHAGEGLKLLALVVRVNFSDFFPGNGGSLAATALP